MDTTWAREKPEEDGETSRAGRNIDISKIISRMHSYRTDLGGFVDREGEAREILEWGFGKPVRGGMITVLYGPKGCGKSTLFGATGYAIEDVPDIELITITARELEGVRRVVLDMRRSMRDLLQRIISKLSIRADWIDFSTLTITGGVSLLGAAWEIARLIKYAVVDAKEEIDKKY